MQKISNNSDKIIRRTSKEKLIRSALEGRKTIFNDEKLTLLELLNYVLNNEPITEIKIIVGYFWWFDGLKDFFEIVLKKKIRVKILMGNQTSPNTVELFELFKKGIQNNNIFLKLLNERTVICRFPKKSSNLRIHSKYYILKNNEDIRYAFIGSANLTKPGVLEKYEAIVLAPQETWTELDYTFDRIWNDDSLVDDPQELEYIRGLDGVSVTIFTPSVTETEVLSYVMWILDKEKISIEGKLTPLQQAEYQRVLKIFERSGGAFLTSSVGTGKSYVIKEVIREFLKEQNSIVFLIAPTTIIGKSFEKSQWYGVLTEEPRISEKIQLFGEEKLEDEIPKLIENKGTKIWLVGIGAVRALSSTGNNLNKNFKEAMLNVCKNKNVLIVIDEAHHFRNSDSQGTRLLLDILNALDTQNDLKVLLSTATPLNVRIDDLITMFKLAFKSIRSERKEEYDIEVNKELKIYSKLISYENLEVLLKEFDPKAPHDPIREMRELFFVKSDWDDVFSSPENLISLVAKNKYNDLKDKIGNIKGQEFFNKLIHQSIKGYKIKDTPWEELWRKINEEIPELFFAPYCFTQLPEQKTINDYVKTLQETYEVNKVEFEKINNNSGIIKIDGNINEILLTDKEGKIELMFAPWRVRNLNVTYKIILAKRAESSIFSFLITLLRYNFKNYIFKRALEENFKKNNTEVYLKEFFKENERVIKEIDEISKQSYSEEDLDEEDIKCPFQESLKKISEKLSENIEHLLTIVTIDKLRKIKFKGVSEHRDISILEMVKSDYDSLRKLTEISYKILKDIPEELEDPKMEKLIEVMRNANNTKLLAFSSFADTLNYIRYYLEKKKDVPPVKNRVIYYTADTRDKLSAPELVKKFNNWDESKERLDYIFATDVLSEGVNLGEAKIFVNYDVEFNPVRIIQRAGRVMRIKWFAEKLAEESNLENIRKEINLIIPEDDFVSETVAKILHKVENRLSAIISVIGLDYTLMQTERIKEALKNEAKLKELLNELQKEVEIKEGTTIPEYLKDIYMRYFEKIRLEQIRDVKNEIKNFYVKAGVFEEQGNEYLIKSNPIIPVISTVYLPQLAIETKVEDRNHKKKLVVNINDKNGAELDISVEYDYKKWAEKLKEMGLKLKFEDEKIEFDQLNPQQIEELFKYFQLLLKGW